MESFFLFLKVLLDPTLTKNKDKSDWKSMKEELTKAGKLKVRMGYEKRGEIEG